MQTSNLQGQMAGGAQSEQTLRERVEHPGRLTERKREVFWLASADRRRIFYLSPSYEGIWGRSCESLWRDPMSWLEAIHPKDRPGIEAEMAHDHSDRFAREFRIVRPDGAIRWILARGFAMRDKRGHPWRVGGLAEDITERKHLEQALHESQSALAEAQRAARIGRWSMNVRTGEVVWSDELYRIFGLDKSKFGGTQEAFLACVLPEDRPRVLQTHAQAGADARPFCIDCRIVTPAGELKVIQEIGAAVQVDAGQAVALIGTAQDITRRKQAERDLQRVITERKQAEKRTQMFSREIVAAREEERSRVSSVLHHDVGSLAVGISAYLDAIEKDLHSGKPGEALKWMRRTRQLFDKSVVGLKGLAVEIRPPELDVLGLCAALRQHFSRITKPGNTRIRFRESQQGQRVSANAATILFRVAQEALTNAIKHGHAKQVDVDLRTSKEEIRLAIRDNGKGFDPFAQRTQTTSQLGLRVMREMAASAGGAFTVESGPGKGTTVRLTLPGETAGLGLTGATARGKSKAPGRPASAALAQDQAIRAATRSARQRKGSHA